MFFCIRGVLGGCGIFPWVLIVATVLRSALLWGVLVGLRHVGWDCACLWSWLLLDRTGGIAWTIHIVTVMKTNSSVNVFLDRMYAIGSNGLIVIYAIGLYGLNTFSAKERHLSFPTHHKSLDAYSYIPSSVIAH